MEGLHHDTNLEPTRTHMTDIHHGYKHSGSTSLEMREDFASLDLNKNLSVEDKINLYDQIILYCRSLEPTNREGGGFCIFTSVRRYCNCQLNVQCWIMGMPLNVGMN